MQRAEQDDEKSKHERLFDSLEREFIAIDARLSERISQLKADDEREESVHEFPREKDNRVSISGGNQLTSLAKVRITLKIRGKMKFDKNGET